MSRLEIFKGQAVCEVHGPYTYTARRVGRIEVGKVCPSCLLDGQKKAEQKQAVRSAQLAEQERQQQLELAQVPKTFRDCTLASYEIVNERADLTVRTVKSYLDNFTSVLQLKPVPGMVFSGVPGTGKTHLASLMIAELLSRGHSAMYCTAPNFLIEMEDARFGRHDLSTTALIKRYTKPQLLVLDEYGAHSTREIDYQALFSVIDSRYQSNLPTVLITNLQCQREGSALADASMPLSQAIDDRLIERIRGHGGPLFAFDWPSFRHRASHGLVA